MGLSATKIGIWQERLGVLSTMMRISQARIGIAAAAATTTTTTAAAKVFN